MIKDLTNPSKNNALSGKIIIRADTIVKNNDELLMRVKASLTPMTSMGCCAGTNNPYYVISRARQDNANEFVRVYQSDILNNNINPTFNPNKH